MDNRDTANGGPEAENRTAAEGGDVKGPEALPENKLTISLDGDFAQKIAGAIRGEIERQRGNWR